MQHQLILEVPEEVYAPLAQAAQETGTPPEQLAVAWLRAASRHVVRDPLEPFIGAFPSRLPGWAEQHDQYLGQALKDQPRAGEAAGG